jgi:hypothetical protein
MVGAPEHLSSVLVSLPCALPGLGRMHQNRVRTKPIAHAGSGSERKSQRLETSMNLGLSHLTARTFQSMRRHRLRSFLFHYVSVLGLLIVLPGRVETEPGTTETLRNGSESRLRSEMFQNSCVNLPLSLSQTCPASAYGMRPLGQERKRDTRSCEAPRPFE